jgi:hypothetical protein
MFLQSIGHFNMFFIGGKEEWKQMLNDSGLGPAAAVRLFCFVIKLHCFL